MTLLWFVSGASLVAALLAWRRARRTAQRLEELSQMHWELRYQHGELRVRLDRLADGASPPIPSDGQAAGGDVQTSRPEQARESFVPLASLKR